MPIDRDAILNELAALRGDAPEFNRPSSSLTWADHERASGIARQIVDAQFDLRQLASIDRHLVGAVESIIRQIMSSGLTKSQRQIGEVNRFFEPLSPSVIQDH